MYEPQLFICINTGIDKYYFAYVSNQEETYYIIKEETDKVLYSFFSNIFCHQFTEKEFNDKFKNYKEVFTFKDLQPTDEEDDKFWNDFIKYNEELKERSENDECNNCEN